MAKSNQKKYIDILESFKKLLNEYNDDYLNDNSELRTKINQEKYIVQKIVTRAGSMHLMSISPPPMVGGYVLQNLNPFDIIFDAPYGINVIYSIIDSIDEAIGSIKADKDFSIETISKKVTKTNLENKISIPDNKSIFIVHGHDNELKEQVARFVEKLGLNPVILHEKTNSSMTIIEKFEKFSNTKYAIVLISPDDIGASIKEPEKLIHRARQNVIFELGYFFGKLGRSNVCALLKGNIERPSDYDGILYIAHDNKDGWKLLMVKELKQAGLDFDSNKIFD